MNYEWVGYKNDYCNMHVYVNMNMFIYISLNRCSSWSICSGAKHHARIHMYIYIYIYRYWCIYNHAIYSYVNPFIFICRCPSRSICSGAEHHVGVQQRWKASLGFQGQKHIKRYSYVYICIYVYIYTYVCFLL
jgi:hypothetical protein